MSKYTKYGKNVDKVIDKHLKFITNELRDSLGENLLSLVLIGGFARGEGSFDIKKKQPLNDYDIYAITKKPVKSGVLQKVSLDFIKECNINSNFSFTKGAHVMNFYADFRNLTLSQLKTAVPLIKYFEMKNSGKVIYGKEILKEMPNIKIEDIPIEDGLRFLFNRMSLLIECFKPSFIEHKFTQKEKEAVLFYVSKAYLTCAEALLLKSKRFVSSYSERSNIFKDTYVQDFPRLKKQIPNLTEKVDKYTKFKLKPTFDRSNKEILNSWLEAKKDLLVVTDYFMNEIYGLKAGEISKIGHKLLLPYVRNETGIDIPILNSIAAKLAGTYLNILYFKESVRGGNFYFKQLLSFRDPLVKLYSVIPVLLTSIGKDGKINTKLLKNAIKQLKDIYPPPNVGGVSKEKLLDISFRYYSDAFRVYQFLVS